MKLIVPKLIVIVFLLSVYSCSVHEEIEKKPAAEREIEELNIPDGFDFSTQQEVRVVINDDEDDVKYDVYSYSEEKYFSGMETFENEEGEIVTDSVFKSDILNKLLFTGAPVNGQIKQTIIIPKYFSKLYLRRRKRFSYSASVEQIYNNEVTYTASNISGKSLSIKDNVEDFFYGVNGSGELFQINPLTGELVEVSDMPQGSYTCAMDQENKFIYSIGRKSPFPLMRYSIDNSTWEIIANIGEGGTRLDFRKEDGLLYFSSKSKLYAIEPTTGVILNTWNINGLHQNGGGDLAFAEDGTLFLCTFSGLYRLELDANNEYQSIRISENNLPFKPNSMTFDSNQELWLATNSTSSELVIMDTQTGAWEYQYGKKARNNTDFGRKISDLTTFTVSADVVSPLDTDNDGVSDINDKFPEDPEKAFEAYTPSPTGWGTLAFEDLWPSLGDNDFNDVALNYRVLTILNSNNEVVELNFVYDVKANGASSINGFGIEFESLSPNQIESVSGNVLSEGFINESINGTESGQDNAVVILFDNARIMLNKETVVSIKFTEPITTEELGVAPFNPFIIINKVREKEVHLPYAHTTTLGSTNIEIEGYNKDQNGDYVTDEGLPWAINIQYNFKVPKEKIAINKAYNYFNQWATSGGGQYEEWYKDHPGHRNEDKLQD